MIHGKVSWYAEITEQMEVKRGISSTETELFLGGRGFEIKSPFNFLLGQW